MLIPRSIRIICVAWFCCSIFCLSQERISSQSSTASDSIIAARLALRSQTLLAREPDAVELAALLAIESMARHESENADYILRSVMSLLRKSLGYIQHKKPIRSVAVSIDGTWIVTGSDDNTTKITKRINNNQELIGTISHNGLVVHVVVSPNDKYAASASTDGTIGIFDLEHSRKLLTPSIGKPFVSIAFNPDSRWIAAAGQDNIAHVFDLAGHEIAKFNHKGSLQWVAFDSKSTTLITAGGNIVCLFDFPQGSGRPERAIIKLDSVVRGIAVSPISSLIAVATANGKVKISNLQNVADSHELLHMQDVKAVAFSEDGQLLATGSTDDIARVYEVGPSCKEIAQFMHNGSVNSVGFAGTGILITGSTDHTMRLFDIRDRRQLPRFKSSGTAFRAAASVRSNLIVIPNAETAGLFNIREGLNETPLYGKSIIRTAAFSDERVSIATKGGIQVFDRRSGGRLKDIATGRDPVRVLAYSPNSRFIAITHQSGVTQFFDGDVPQEIANEGRERKPVDWISFSEDSDSFAIAGNASEAPLETQAYVRMFTSSPLMEIGTGVMCPGSARSVAISNNHQLVAIGTTDTICIFDFVRRRHGTFPYKDINAIVFTPHNDFIAIGTENKEVHIFETWGKEVLGDKQEGAVVALTVSQDGQILVSKTRQGIVHVFDMVKRVHTAVLPADDIAAIAYSQNRLSELIVDRTVDPGSAFIQRHPILSRDIISDMCSIINPRKLTNEEWKKYVGGGSPQERCSEYVRK